MERDRERQVKQGDYYMTELYWNHMLHIYLHVYTFTEPISGDLFDLRLKVLLFKTSSHDDHDVQHASCHGEVMRQGPT